jgi:sensor histidine kinase YesM
MERIAALTLHDMSAQKQMKFSVDRSSILAFLRDLFFFALASVFMTSFMCPECNTTRLYAIISLFTFFTWVFLWKGNSLITRYVSCRIPWMEFPVKRLVVGVISTVSYTIAVMLLLRIIFEASFHINFGNRYISTIYFTLVFTIIISLILHSREFLISLKKATVNAERLEKESIQAKYESLKNQVNPHFLFNSFNALTNLVYEDPDKAVKFIKQLSDVYRYVLDTREKETVPLAEEMKFLHSYIYLQEIRFGEKLKFEISVNDSTGFVAPLAMQMLIENAIKHNVVSSDDPLVIAIYVEDNFIAIKNNLQPKTVLAEPSAGVGLENISRRYQFLSSTPVEIVKTENSFLVRLPLLSKAI